MTQTDKTTPTPQDQTPAPESEVTGLAEYNAELLTDAPGLREAFMVMLANVPEPDPDATEAQVRMLAQILSAENAGDLDKPWDSDGMRSYFDRMLTVKSITRRPSDYVGGLGVYLGCDCILHETGEELFISCGAVMCVGQLVRAHTLGILPLIIVPRPAKKPTRKGYTPYHLEVQGRAARS